MSGKTAHETFPLCDHVDQLVDTFRQALPEALAGDDAEAIHRARVASRRVKAAIDLFEPVIPRQPRRRFLRMLRKVRRCLGRVRDIDVMLSHLDDLRGKRPELRAAIDWLNLKLQARRDRMLEKTGQAVRLPKVLAKAGAWWGIREELHGAREAVDSLLASSSREQMDRLVEQADLLAKQFADEGGGDASVEECCDPHQLRIAGKSLRYTLEMAQVEGHGVSEDVTNTFKRLQDALGTWHDFIVLTEATIEQSADESLARHDAALQQRVLDLSKVALAAAEDCLRNAATLWREHREVLIGSVRAAFSLTQEFSEWQTDPDPSGSGEPPAREDDRQDDSAAA